MFNIKKKKTFLAISTSKTRFWIVLKPWKRVWLSQNKYIITTLKQVKMYPETIFENEGQHIF